MDRLPFPFPVGFGLAAGDDDSVAVVAGDEEVGGADSGGCESVLVAITGYVRMWSVIACDMVAAAAGFHAPSELIRGFARSRWSIILSELVNASSSGV